MSTYFLAPKTAGGLDTNTGSITSPFFTWTKLWTVLKPGDVVECRGGKYEYDKAHYLGPKNGTQAAPITIRAYQNEVPIFTKSAAYAATEQDLFFIEIGNWLRFIGLDISGVPQAAGKSAWAAFRLQEGSNNIFERINYHHNGAAFSLRGNSSNNLFLNCDFHDNQDPYSSDAYGGADGIDLHYITGTNNVVKGCRAYWNSDDGFDCWENSGHVLFEDCWSFYNGYRSGTFTAAGDGSGFKLGETSGEYFSTLLRTVKNCLAYKNRKYGIAENNLKAKSLVENFTAVEHGVLGYYVGQWNGTKAVMTIKNSVSYKNPEDIPAHVVQVNNSWQGHTVTDSDFVSLDHTQLVAPRKADGSLPDLTFYKTTGIDIGGLGAVFQGTVVTPPPPPPTGDVVTKCQMVCYPVSGTLKTVTATSFTKKSDGYYVGTSKRDIHSYKDETGKWRFL